MMLDCDFRDKSSVDWCRLLIVLLDVIPQDRQHCASCIWGPSDVEQVAATPPRGRLCNVVPATAPAIRDPAVLPAGEGERGTCHAPRSLPSGESERIILERQTCHASSFRLAHGPLRGKRRGTWWPGERSVEVWTDASDGRHQGTTAESGRSDDIVKRYPTVQYSLI